MTGWNPDVERCPPEARAAALQVLYRRIPEALRPRLIDEVLLEAASGLIDLSGLWVARGRAWASRAGWGPPEGRITGALLTQALAGRAAAVWAPEVEPSVWRGATATALVRSALDDLRARGFRLAQAVLDESAGRRGARDLARGGMPRVTELLYLERDTRIPLPAPVAGRSDSSSPRLRWRSFNPAHEAEFRTLLQATYASSLDMPELEGVR